jgi:hypothetical protein
MTPTELFRLIRSQGTHSPGMFGAVGLLFTTLRRLRATVEKWYVSFIFCINLSEADMYAFLSR